jgi:hypothetical protein
MASKLLPLNDAAALLGVTPDELTTMRLDQLIYGYRDGSSWKFKVDDLERLKEERAASQESPLTGDDFGDFGSASSTSDSSLSSLSFGDSSPSKKSSASSSDDDMLPVDISGGDDDEIVLLSEVELGASGESTSSTIIGQGKPAKMPLSDESDLKLGDSAIGSGDGSDVKLAGGSDINVLGSGSELPLGLSESATVLKSTANSDLGLQSDVKLIGGLGGSGSGFGDSGLSLASGDSGLSLAAGDSGLSLVDDDLGLATEPSKSSGGSSLNLSEDEDVLGGGSGSGSDITHRPSDSGILLIDPSDSGLSLDKPFDLGAGSDPSMQTSDFVADTGDLGELRADDDFLLTPLEEAGEDESDSGSQVIMLETEGEFDDATATLLASQVPGLGAGSMLEEESPLGGMGDASAGGRVPAGAAGGAPMMMIPAKAETPFSALQVLGLAACTIAVAMCGIMLHDVVRNMWSWDNSYSVNSALMNTFKW